MYLLAFQVPLLPIFGGYSAGALPSLSLGFVWDVIVARAAAGAVDRAGGNRRLGAGDARHDGDDDGRGLRDLRRGEGAEEPDHLPALLPAQRDPAADHGAGAGARPDPVGRGAGGGDLRVSRHRRAAVPGDPGERLLPDPGHRVHRDRGAGLGDADPRRGVSVARSADLVSEEREDVGPGPTSSATSRGEGLHVIVRYLRRNLVAGRRHRAAVAARAVHRHRQPHRRYRTRAPAVGARLAAAVLGASVRHRPAGTRPAGRDGRRHAADPQDRLHRRLSRRRHRHRAGVHRRLLSRHDRHA